MADTEKPAAASVPAKSAPPKPPERFVVEQHKSFEIMGSTVTFREHQIISDPRELKIAQDHGVALRPLAPIK